jgi:tetratricopeptide (TPR) repeat protein
MEERKVLDSWKEIAAYLKRSERTCHRWEVELDLPIHRLDGTPKARVFAYTDELDHWAAEKPFLAEIPAAGVETQKSKKAKWLFIGVSAAIGLAAIAFVVSRAILLKPIPIPTNKPYLVVLDFDNPAGDESLEAWKSSLPDLIAEDLMQSRLIRVESFPLDSRFDSIEKLIKQAEKVGVDYTAGGSLARAGENFVVTVQVQNLKTKETGKPIRVVCRDENDIMAKTDALTKEIKLAMKLSPRQVSRDVDDDVVKVSSCSPQAFKLFSQAMRIRKAVEAIALLVKAVEVDPDFALAYESLYQQSGYGRREAEREKYLRKAFELSSRLPEKERLLTQSDYYRESQGDWDRAAEACEKLLALNPGDWEASVKLQNIYMRVEEWDKAIPVCEGIIQRNKIRNSLADGNLATCYAAKGQYDKAAKVVDDFLKSSPSAWRAAFLAPIFYYKVRRDYDSALKCLDQVRETTQPRTYLLQKGGLYIAQDNFSSAELEFRKVLEMDNKLSQINALDNLGTLYLHEGKLEAAKNQYQTGLELSKSQKAKDWDGAFHAMLAHVFCLSGNFQKARTEIEEACQSQFKSLEDIGRYDDYIYYYPYYLQLLHERALISLESNDIQAFERQARELKESIERDPRKKFMRRYFHLLGHRELKRNNVQKAIDYFEKALALQPFQNPLSEQDLARYFYSLAEAYYKAGNLEKARETFQKTAGLVKEEYGESYALSFYWLGRIHERRGEKAKAAESYQKFLSLWKDADPVFAEVGDAKTRLAGLAGSQ